MNNYQLYRTNAKLGGQVAWNLVLEGLGSGDLAVSYFDLTPISPNVNYKYGQNRDCVRYSHQENLRTLYSEIKGQFYDAVIDPRLTTIYPILDGSDKDTRDSSLDLGCSRISFDRYNKQFQVFCPVWLEDFKLSDKLGFTVSLYSFTTEKQNNEEITVENILATRQLILDLKNDRSYHDSFVTYFRNYLNSIIDGDVIGDDVLNVNVTDKFASIHGLDLKTGKLTSKDISNLVPNLFERERPLMETDFMLIDNFHTSTMIAKQLFNFNLVFSISDLVSKTMDSMIKDDEFFIKVDVVKYVEEDTENKNPIVLEKRSFNNNYSSLERTSVSFKDIFQYLHDDRCIDNIRDNKLAPDICHWTLNDNTGYIFNVYPGFGTTYDMFYKDAPNYWEYDTVKYPNALNWINCYDLTKNDREVNRGPSSIINSIMTNLNFTEFSPKLDFVKDTRIDVVESSDDSDDITDLHSEYLASYIIETTSVVSICNTLNNNNIHDYICLAVDSLDSDDMDIYISDSGSFSDGEYIVDNINTIDNSKYVIFSCTPFDNYYMFITNSQNKNLLSYKWLNRNISKLYQFIVEHSSNEYLRTVDKVLEYVVYPKFIYLYNSLGIKRADSPWVDTNEIYYVKVNNRSNVVIRYDGKIKPMFSKFNDLVLYRVRKMTAEEFSVDPSFQKDTTQGFLPNYPSVNYFNLEVIDDSKDKPSLNHYTYNEYKWFNESRIFNLLTNINVRVLSKQLDHYYTNDELIDKVLRDTYPFLTSKYMSYIRSIYSIDISYEYDVPAWNTDTDQFDYIYTINLKLK